MWQLLIEAIVVGLLTCAVGAVTMYFVADIHIFHKHLVKILVALFVTGVLIHLGCEFSGLNKWYCKNGHACGNGK